MNPIYSLKNLWEVLVVFLIPFGGGIPGGVILAQKKGFYWPVMMFLYLISDIILACTFEPLMILFIQKSKNNPHLQKMGEVFKLSVHRTLDYYGNKTGVLALIMIAFGVDPMTGRGVAKVAGHGFITGWMIAIAGDMMYFTLLMVSTLWLNHIIGDGTTTMYIILAFILAFPYIGRKIKAFWNKLNTQKQ